MDWFKQSAVTWGMAQNPSIPYLYCFPLRVTEAGANSSQVPAYHKIPYCEFSGHCPAVPSRGLTRTFRVHWVFTLGAGRKISGESREQSTQTFAFPKIRGWSIRDYLRCIAHLCASTLTLNNLESLINLTQSACVWTVGGSGRKPTQTRGQHANSTQINNSKSVVSFKI